MIPRARLIVIATLLMVSTVAAGEPATRNNHNEIGKTERLAVEYLSTEIPRWRPQHRCSSCHHQGDGARALFFAKASGIEIQVEELKDTIVWLSKPREWDMNGPDGPFSDRKLARIQFANSLAAAITSGIVAEKQPLIQACEQLVNDQVADGSWEFTGADEIGSPINYGRPLATATAIRVLRQSGDPHFDKHIRDAEQWLLMFEPRSVLNAAAVLAGLADSKATEAAAQRERCLKLIQRGQSDDGGWGPYLNSPPEPFDTGVVLWCLSNFDSDEWGDNIRLGRGYLQRSQLSDGSWPETTRPALRESYAHRVSTTAWALTGLLATRKIGERGTSVP